MSNDLPFDITLFITSKNCINQINVDGSYTARGNNERNDTYNGFNNNAIISVG